MTQPTGAWAAVGGWGGPSWRRGSSGKSWSGSSRRRRGGFQRAAVARGWVVRRRDERSVAVVRPSSRARQHEPGQTDRQQQGGDRKKKRTKSWSDIKLRRDLGAPKCSLSVLWAAVLLLVLLVLAVAQEKAGEARPESCRERRRVAGVTVWSVDTLRATLSMEGREAKEAEEEGSDGMGTAKGWWWWAAGTGMGGGTAGARSGSKTLVERVLKLGVERLWAKAGRWAAAGAAGVGGSSLVRKSARRGLLEGLKLGLEGGRVGLRLLLETTAVGSW